MDTKTKWLLCPYCKAKTRIKVRADTILIKLPLYCPKCRHEYLINVKSYKVIILNEPDARRRADTL